MQAAVPGCFVKRWWGAWASKVSTGDFCARLSRAALFDPRDHAKKDPKKLCAFWGFISVPVVGVEPTRCHHQRILSRYPRKARKSRFDFFKPFSFSNCTAKIADVQAKIEVSNFAVRKNLADILDIKSKCASGHTSKCGRIVCAAIRIKE